MAIKKRDTGVIEEVSEVTSSQKFKLKDLIDKSEALGYRKFIAKGAFFGVFLKCTMIKVLFFNDDGAYLQPRKQKTPV